MKNKSETCKTEKSEGNTLIKNRYLTFSSLQSPVSSLLISVLLVTVAYGQDDYVWEQLWDGEDLGPWNFHIVGSEYNEDPYNTLKVSDGILHVDYSEYDSFLGSSGEMLNAHFGRDEVYSHFIIGVEYRFVGEQAAGGNQWNFRNSGILFHSQAMSEMTLTQRFPTSVEAQLLQRGDENPVAIFNICPIQTNIREAISCNGNSNSIPIGDPQEWTRADVLVRADSIAHFILNGDTLGTYHDFTLQSNDEPLTEGTISFQAESHPIDFRKIEIVNLVGCMDDSANNYKDYYVVHDEDVCDYTVDVTPPKATDGKVQIDNAGVSISGTGIVRVEVYDVHGRRTITEMGMNKLNRRFSNLEPGLYVVRAVSGNRQVTGRVVRFD